MRYIATATRLAIGPAASTTSGLRQASSPACCVMASLIQDPAPARYGVGGDAPSGDSIRVGRTTAASLPPPAGHVGATQRANDPVH